MSGLLRDVMKERAAQAPAEGIDAATIVAAGRSRVRRRRGAGMLATAACVVLVTTGVAGVVSRDDRADGGFAPPAAQWEPAAVTWSHGRTMIEGERSWDVGQDVMSFVVNADGIVWTSRDGGVHLLSRETGDSVDIGRTDTTRYTVRAEPDGPLVAWAQWRAGRAPQFVVYDTSSRQEVSRDAETEADYTGKQGIEAAQVYAVDDGTVYRQDSRGVVAVDVAAGRATVLDPEADMDSIGDAAAGTVVWERPTDHGYSVGPRYGKGVRTGRSSMPLLSPGGTYLSTEDGDEFHIQRTSDASVVTPRLPTYPFAAAYGWIDDDTVAVYAIDRKVGGFDATYPLDFLTCSVSTGSCRVVGSGVSDLDSLSLPVGEHLGG